MPYPETTTAFAITDTKKWSDFKKQELPMKTFEDYDVDVAIDACGVCASDVHTITGGWGGIPGPIAVGHEIIGKAIKVGSKVTTVKLGDRVGVGAQVGADLTCNNCKEHQENYCPNSIDTYGAKYPEGVLSQGGFSSHIRVHEYFVFKIPENIATELAAPMLCAGITTYSPLVRLGTGAGKHVAIIGLGGLGHFAVLWAKALGAEVTVISHSDKKVEDAKALGAKHHISTGEEGWHKPFQHTFDIVLNTASNMESWKFSEFFSIVKVNGFFHNVAMPNDAIKLRMQDFMPSGCYLGVSHLGNRQEMQAMLELASKQNIKSWVETIEMSEEGCKEAVERVHNHDRVRYRFTLVNFDKPFGKRS